MAEVTNGSKHEDLDFKILNLIIYALTFNFECLDTSFVFEMIGFEILIFSAYILSLFAWFGILSYVPFFYIYLLRCHEIGAGRRRFRDRGPTDARVHSAPSTPLMPPGAEQPPHTGESEERVIRKLTAGHRNVPAQLAEGSGDTSTNHIGRKQGNYEELQRQLVTKKLRVYM